MTDTARPLTWHRGIVALALFAYCAMFLVHLPAWVPSLLRRGSELAKGSIQKGIQTALSAGTGGNHGSDLDSAAYLFLVAGVVPLVFALACRRGLRDIGFHKPNRLGWRYFIVAVVVASPFLFWMVQSPTISRAYLRQWERLGVFAFCAYYLVNMFTEHMFLHGVVLGLARRDGRWPAPAPVPTEALGAGRFLRWLGLANQSIRSGCSRWLGLAPGCIGPMFFSSLLFGMVHLGKDARELILSFPGGLAQAYAAYRSNSWWTPFLIHLATALIAFVMMAR